MLKHSFKLYSHNLVRVSNNHMVRELYLEHWTHYVLQGFLQCRFTVQLPLPAVQKEGDLGSRSFIFCVYLASPIIDNFTLLHHRQYRSVFLRLESENRLQHHSRALELALLQDKTKARCSGRVRQQQSSESTSPPPQPKYTRPTAGVHGPQARQVPDSDVRRVECEVPCF